MNRDWYDSSTNARVCRNRIPAYYCASDRPNAQYLPASANLNKFSQVSHGNFAVNLGRTRAYDSTSVRAAPFGSKSSGGSLGYVPYRSKISDVTDGSSKTLLMSEIRLPPRDDVDDWRGSMLIESFSIFFTAAAPPNSGTDRNWNSSAFPKLCDGTIDPAMPCTGTGDDLAEWQTIARSRHPGGVNAAFCDGSVTFVPNSIDPGVWQELSTMNSGNPVGAW